MWITYMYKPIGLGLAIQFVGPDDVVAEEHTPMYRVSTPAENNAVDNRGSRVI